VVGSHDDALPRHLLFGSHAALQEACALLERATSLDPQYAEPHAWLALSYQDRIFHWRESIEGGTEKARYHAAAGVRLAPKDSVAWMASAVVSLYWGRWEDAVIEFKNSVSNNPNNADAWIFFSDAFSFVNRAAEQLEFALRGMRLNPRPPYWYFWILGQAQYEARSYELAVETIDKLPPESDGRRWRVAALAQLGRIGEAHIEAQNYLRHHPEFTITRWVAQFPFRDPAPRDHIVEGLRKAGLPE
jgi:tetratricopeptide (TPR) repeat protein